MFGKEKEQKEFFEVFKKPHDAEDKSDFKVHIRFLLKLIFILSLFFTLGTLVHLTL